MAFDFSMVGGIWDQVYTVLLRGITFLIIMGVAFGLYFYFNRKKKFNHTVRVYEYDTMGNLIEKIVDNGGFFINKKTRNQLFMLKKMKVGMRADKVPFMLNNKGGRIVHILQTGLMNFQYLCKPEIASNPHLVFNVQDEDYAWAVNALDKFIIPSKMTLWKQILPHITLLLTGFFMLMFFYIMFKEGGFNAALLRDLSANAKDIAASLARASLGTTVVGG